MERHDRLNEYYDESKFIDTKAESGKLNDSEKEILKLAINKDWSTPRYKMRWFQGQAQISKWAVFRQYLMELRNIEEALELQEYNLEKSEAEIEIYQFTAEKSPNPGERKLAEVEIRNLKRKIERNVRMKNDLMLQRHYYLDLINETLDTPEGQVPDGSGRTWLDIVRTDEQDVWEREHWTNRLGKQAALDIMFYGRVGVGNMDAILQMPEDQQAETLVLATDYALHLQAYQKQLQLDCSERANQGLGFDKRDLQFPANPTELLENMKRELLAKAGDRPTPPTAIENSGDDLDVYNV